MFFDSWYQAFLYLPAMVVIQKLIPEGIESSISGIFKSLQAFSVGVYGRMIGVLLGRMIILGDQIPHQLNLVLFFAMIVLAGVAAVLFWLTRILPKEQDIEEAQQSIFYEMTINRTANLNQTRTELNMIHKLAQVKIHESESLTSSADFLLMDDDHISK